MPRPEQFRHRHDRGGILLPAAVFLLCLLVLPVAARPDQGPEVLRVRHFTGPDYTRIVLDLSRPCSFEVLEEGNTQQLAVNVRNGRFRLDGSIPVNDGLVKRIRQNPGADQAQVVIDLDRDYTFKSFSLPAADGRPDRVVVDVFRTIARANTSSPANLPTPAAPDLARIVTKPSPRQGKPFTVVIDPGHGGMDPGAIRGKVQEKDVALGVAKESRGSSTGCRAIVPNSPGKPIISRALAAGSRSPRKSRATCSCPSIAIPTANLRYREWKYISCPCRGPLTVKPGNLRTRRTPLTWSVSMPVQFTTTWS